MFVCPVRSPRRTGKFYVVCFHWPINKASVTPMTAMLFSNLLLFFFLLKIIVRRRHPGQYPPSHHNIQLHLSSIKHTCTEWPSLKEGLLPPGLPAPPCFSAFPLVLVKSTKPSVGLLAPTATLWSQLVGILWSPLAATESAASSPSTPMDYRWRNRQLMTTAGPGKVTTYGSSWKQIIFLQQSVTRNMLKQGVE